MKNSLSDDDGAAFERYLRSEARAKFDVRDVEINRSVDVEDIRCILIGRRTACRNPVWRTIHWTLKE